MKQDIRKRFDVRSRALFVIMALLALVIAIRLIFMQVINYDHYLEMVIDNIQQETGLKADRGVIYDRNMNVIATNVTTYRVFISPADIETDEDARLIADELSDILEVDYNEIYEKTQKKNRKDETVKKKATEAFVCWKISDYSFNFHACDGSVKIFYFFLVEFWEVVLF